MKDDQYYADLHHRIVEGAKYIEESKPDNPKLPVAHQKYDRLVAEYREHIKEHLKENEHG